MNLPAGGRPARTGGGENVIHPAPGFKINGLRDCRMIHSGAIRPCAAEIPVSSAFPDVACYD